MGILFVPLAFICAIIATIKAVKGSASKLVAIIAWILSVVAFATSPVLLSMLGFGMARLKKFCFCERAKAKISTRS